ncbi:peptidylprolyl isomerase [Candidatus Pelagibacter sp.]|nr:peptidylprolyl isomerase [Candidatus Pelagibacter sp.]
MLKIIFLTIILFNLLINNSFSKNKVYVSVTIDDQILTNIDIEKEADYLKTLNPNLSEVNEKKILQISKNSLINEIIKVIEIKKIFDLNNENPYVDEYLKDLYLKLGFNNENEFVSYLKSSTNYSFDEVRNKIKVELMWNELIYYKYSDQINIDKEELIKKIDNQSKISRKEYLLSEIVIKKKKDENLDNLIEKIKLSISKIGFNNTANIYSVSDSSKFGGKIGWIDQSNLSKLVFDELKNVSEKNFTKPIKIGNDYLILKVEEIREKKNLVNKEEELNKLIKFETNKQLNQFSKIFFEKSKMNYLINEK